MLTILVVVVHFKGWYYWILPSKQNHVRGEWKRAHISPAPCMCLYECTMLNWRTELNVLFERGLMLDVVRGVMQMHARTPHPPALHQRSPLPSHCLRRRLTSCAFWCVCWCACTCVSMLMCVLQSQCGWCYPTTFNKRHGVQWKVATLPTQLSVQFLPLHRPVTTLSSPFSHQKCGSRESTACVVALASSWIQ